MAGKIIAEGKGHDLFNVEIQKTELLKVIPGHLKYYFNPPVFALPFAGLSCFPLMPAYWIWTVLSLIALFIGVFLITSLSGLKGREKWLFGTAALAFEPTYHNLHWGNVSAFVLLLAALFFRDLLAGKDQRAGVWLALLMIKPELFLIPAMVVAIKRKWLFLKGYLGMGLLLLILSLAIVGLDGFGDYIKMNLEAARSYTEVQTELHLSNMISFRAFFVRFLYGTAIAEIFSFIYTALSLFLLWMVWRGDWKTDLTRFGLQWSLTFLVSLLVAPHVYLQSLILIFPAAAMFLHGSNYVNAFRFHYVFPIGILSAVALSWLPEIKTAMGLTIIQLALFSATLFLAWILLVHGQAVVEKKYGNQ
ncbi:MAG: DUF2029 domain-containing protein [Deltaproteobacteria bacterium]|nr:DUF2029 domain-containing protein [Deltaproteobacteria bacterium]